MILHLVRPLFPRIECMNNVALKSDLRPSYGQINKVVFCDLRRRMAPRTRTTIGQFGVIIVIKSKIRKNFSMIIDIPFLLKHRLSSRYGSCVTLLPIGRHHARSTVSGFNALGLTVLPADKHFGECLQNMSRAKHGDQETGQQHCQREKSQAHRPVSRSTPLRISLATWSRTAG